MTTTESTDVKTAEYMEGDHGWVCTAELSTENCHGHVLRIEQYLNGSRLFSGHGVCQRQSHRITMSTKVANEGYTISRDAGYKLAAETYPFVPDEVCDAPTPELSTTSVELAGLNPLQRKVLGYLLGGDGSTGTRHQAFQHLAEHDFFTVGVTEEYIRPTLIEVLDDNPMSACAEGLGKFKRALGLAVPTRFRGMLTMNGTDIGSVTWVHNGDDLDEAEATLTDTLSFGDLDSEVAGIFYSHDGDGDCNLDFNVRIDVGVEYIEILGPA